MCTKGTPARVRAACHCTHAWLTGGAFVAALVIAFVWTHLLLLLGLAGLVAAGTFAAVRYLMRFTVPVHHHPAEVQTPPVPVRAPEETSVADVLAGAEEIARQAWDASHRPA